MKNTRGLKTAGLVSVAVILFIFGLNFLKGNDLFSSSSVYYTEFEYNALTASAPVTVKGNKVGRIKEITFDYETERTKVAFTVNSALNFSKNSTVRLYENGLMGGNALAIIDAKDGQAAQDGDVLKSEVQKGLVSNLTNNFSNLSSGIDVTLKSADSLMLNLNKMVSDKSETGLNATIVELNSTLKSFKGLSNQMTVIAKRKDASLDVTINKLNKALDNFTKISDNLAKADLNQTVSKMNETLTKVSVLLDKANDSNGSLGRLMNDDQLAKNLEGATKEMEELLRDIKLHPKRYFRVLSKKEIPYKNEK